VIPLRKVIALILAGTSAAAWAGPPYETDDPEPTELGHWEIYAFSTVDGERHDLDGALGLDLNYGAAEGLQLTATLPFAFEDVSGRGWRSGTGDVELAAKYRFVNEGGAGFQAAIFPRVILPTADRDLGGGHAQFLLPLWLQKDFGSTSVFGGGGYEINPGSGNRNFWQTGVAVTHELSNRLSLGAELTRQSPDTDNGHSSTAVNVGLVHKLSGPASLLIAAGPSFSGGQTAFHGYAALGFAF